MISESSHFVEQRGSPKYRPLTTGRGMGMTPENGYLGFIVYDEYNGIAFTVTSAPLLSPGTFTSRIGTSFAVFEYKNWIRRPRDLPVAIVAP